MKKGSFWDYLPAILIVSSVVFLLPRFRTEQVGKEEKKIYNVQQQKDDRIEENRRLIEKNSSAIRDVIGIIASNESRLKDLKVQIASLPSNRVVFKAPPSEDSKLFRRTKLDRQYSDIDVVRTVNTPNVVDPNDFMESPKPTTQRKQTVQRQQSCQRTTTYSAPPVVVYEYEVPYSGCSSSRTYYSAASNCSGGGSTYYTTSSGGCGSVGGGSGTYFAPAARSYQYAAPLQFSPFGGGT